jgi:acetyl-CoA carboxylase biotin carboxyl carrier protein
MEIDKKIIKKLIETLDDLKKSLKGNEIISDDEQIEEEIDDPKAVIKSPIVGTVYLSPEPGAKPFVSVGKKMNHVPSTKDGIVKKVCVDDGQPVEFGQTIIVLE